MQRDLGEPVDFTTARRPGPEVLQGATVRLEPLSADRHARALYEEAAPDPSLWDYLPYGPFPDAGAYAAWIRDVEGGRDPVFYAVVDEASGAPRGVASYLRIVPEHGGIEIGHIWFGPALQRTRQATEAIFLLARHAFDDLGHRRLEWKCNARNDASMRAAARFGFTYEGTFRQHLVLKGRNRDTAWWSILDGEWPAVKAAFERWLDDANFDAEGRQLSALRTPPPSPGPASTPPSTAPGG